MEGVSAARVNLITNISRNADIKIVMRGRSKAVNTEANGLYRKARLNCTALLASFVLMVVFAALVHFHEKFPFLWTGTFMVLLIIFIFMIVVFCLTISREVFIADTLKSLSEEQDRTLERILQQPDTPVSDICRSPIQIMDPPGFPLNAIHRSISSANYGRYLSPRYSNPIPRGDTWAHRTPELSRHTSTTQQILPGTNVPRSISLSDIRTDTSSSSEILNDPQNLGHASTTEQNFPVQDVELSQARRGLQILTETSSSSD